MSSLRNFLPQPVIILLFTTAYLATLGRCADDPDPIPFTYPQATINQFTVGDTIDIAWQSPSPGQHSFDLGLVLPNETLILAIAKSVERTRATATAELGAPNYTIPDQLNNKTIPNSAYQFTIRSSDPKSGFDLNPSRSPALSDCKNFSCRHLVRSAAGNSSTRCAENEPVPRPGPTGSSIRTQGDATSFAALVVALSFATVLLE